MSPLWLELKYGSTGAPLTIYRLRDEGLLRAFGRKALAHAQSRVIEGEAIDPVLALLERHDAKKLQVRFWTPLRRRYAAFPTSGSSPFPAWPILPRG